MNGSSHKFTVPQQTPERCGRAILAGSIGIFAAVLIPVPAIAADPAPASTLEELMNTRVTTVSREESSVGQSAAAIFVVTPEMIRRSGATSIPELLRMVPGVSVGHIDSSKWGVAVRGFNDRFANKLLVQVDGRTVYTPVNGGVYWDTVDYPFDDIERIEVIRGPGGTVWGANAVNGIINIITKPAKDTQGGSLTIGGGTEDRAFTSLRYGGALGSNFHYRVYGKWNEHDRGFNTEGNAQDDWRYGRGGFRIDGKPNPDDTITLQGDYYHGMLGRRDFRASPQSPPTFVRTNTEDEEPSGGNILFRWIHDLGKDSNWALQAYYDYSRRRGTAGTLDFSVNTFDVDFQHQFPLGQRQKVLWGLGYRMTAIKFTGTAAGFDNGFAIGSSPYMERNLVSAFVQDEIQIAKDKLSLTLGSKFEHNEYTGFEYQPSGRLLWTPTKRQTAWASVSRAVRTPSLVENDLVISTLPTFSASGRAIFPRIIPNQALLAEAVIAYELGYRAQVADRLSFDTALFYNRYNRLMVTQTGKAFTDPANGVLTLPINRNNREKADVFGAELSATWKITDWWRIQGQYSWLKMNLHPSLSVERQSPQNQFYLRSSWDLPGNLQIDLTGRYVDNLGGFTPGIKSYLTMDARLAWRPNDRIEIAIVGQNLLDNRHPELGTSPLVRSPLVEVERSVYGQVTYKF